LTPPYVTVLLSVYNGERFLAEAIDSILCQSYKNFEFIIIDDASTDSTPEILRRYEREDSRIKIVTNAANLRLAASLNKGISLASGALIARMDADDVSLPDRLEKQVTFMQANPTVSVCGTALTIYGSSDTTWLPPLDNHSIRAMLFFESCLYHPTIIMRKSIFNNQASPYFSSMLPAEDYDLWSRLAEKKEIIFANLPDPLVRYRTNEGEARKEYKQRQRDLTDLIRLNLLHRAGLNPTDQEFSAHKALALRERGLTNKQLLECFVWALKFYKSSTISGMSSKKTLKRELINRVLQISVANKKKVVSFPMFLVWCFGRIGDRLIKISVRGQNERNR